MDPQAALVELLEALKDEDRDAAIDRAYALANWLEKGGYLPTVRDAERGAFNVTVEHGKGGAR